MMLNKSKLSSIIRTTTSVHGFDLFLSVVLQYQCLPHTSDKSGIVLSTIYWATWCSLFSFAPRNCCGPSRA